MDRAKASDGESLQPHDELEKECIAKAKRRRVSLQYRPLEPEF